MEPSISFVVLRFLFSQATDRKAKRIMTKEAAAVSATHANRLVESDFWVAEFIPWLPIIF